jgi:hypothetical protein
MSEPHLSNHFVVSYLPDCDRRQRVYHPYTKDKVRTNLPDAYGPLPVEEMSFLLFGALSGWSR